MLFNTLPKIILGKEFFTMNYKENAPSKQVCSLKLKDYNYNRIEINTKSIHFQRFYNAGLLENIDESFIEEVQNYWKKHYGKKIDPLLHIAFYNLTGIKEPRLIHGRIMWREIVPYFNDMNIRIGYSDKNIYDKLFNTKNTVQTVIKRVRGNYFDQHNEQLSSRDAFQILLRHQQDLIIKPSDTDNGKSINKLICHHNKLYLDDQKITIQDLEDLYGFNFIIQKVIEQHPIMAAPHPNSTNTLRMVTLRWKQEIHYLLTFARFGSGGSIQDNAGAGGLCVGVKESGDFFDYAIDKDSNVYRSHPTTNFSFNNLTAIPNFEGFIGFVKNLHEEVLHHDYISWDIAVGKNGQPIFLEANYRGASWLYQLTSQRMFGDLTEEILQHVSMELRNNKFKRNVKAQLPIQFRTEKGKLKRKNRSLTKQNRKLRSRNNNLKKHNKKSKQKYNKVMRENKKLKLENTNKNQALQKLQSNLQTIESKYQKTLTSTSWKVTRPLRKIGGLFKKIIKNYRVGG